MYAAVGQNFKSPLFFVPPSPLEGTKAHKCKGGFKAEHYIEMMRQLKPYLDEHYPKGDYVIVRDHAKQHIAKVSENAINEMGMHDLNDYTPQIWDMNILETIWGVFRGNITGKTAKTTDGWYAVYRKAWAEVQQSTIEENVVGMQARLKSIIEAEGKWVPHH
jgi:hypothetical protein